MNYHRTVFLVIAVALTMGSATYVQSKNHGDHKKKSRQAEKFTAAEQMSLTGDIDEVTEVRPILNFLFYIAGEDGELTLEELEFALDKFEALRFEFEEDPEAVIFIEELVAKAASPISPPPQTTSSHINLATSHIYQGGKTGNTTGRNGLSSNSV